MSHRRQRTPRANTKPIKPWIDPLLTHHIAKYRIVDLLATGGMGELYRAKAAGPGGFERDVALKVIRADLAQRPMFKAMFLEEGKIAALLQHANIVHINDFGEDQGQLYLCMELVDGRDAAALVERCRTSRELLAPRFAAYIAEQVAHGLDHAHRLEVNGQPLHVVHRDVSPGNILLSYQGAVKLTDFGVARIRREKSLTAAGLRKGTRAYMAPEQLQNLTDPGSDVFSLAAVLWELLVGFPLFEGATEEQIAEAIRSRPIPPPSAYAPDVPPALDAVVLKALERDPRARHRTARDFALALADLVLTPRVDAFELGCELRRRFPEPREEADEPTAEVVYGATDPHIPSVAEAPSKVAELATAYAVDVVTEPEFRAPPGGGEGQGELASPALRPPRLLLIALSVAASVAALLLLRPSRTEPQRPLPAAPTAAPTVAPTVPAASHVDSGSEPAASPAAATSLMDSGSEIPAEPTSIVVPHPAPKRRHPKPGTLAVIAVRPWVQVFVDGVSRGYSPAPAIPISAGRHQITLSNEDVGLSRTFSVAIPEAGRVVFRGDAKTLQPSADDQPAASPK
jgi:serine/threonine protein kinase